MAKEVNDHGPKANDRLRAELAFNSSRADHEPVTDSSLTYGDLRAMQSILVASPVELADMLRESEPDRQPDGSDTLMEISVEDARKIAWALVSKKCVQTSDTSPSMRDALEALKAAKRLTDNMAEFGACTDDEIFDAAWEAIRAALKSAE